MTTDYAYFGIMTVIAELHFTLNMYCSVSVIYKGLFISLTVYIVGDLIFK